MYRWPYVPCPVNGEIDFPELERLHTERFTALMDQYMPLWQQCRGELNRAPLAHGEWEY